jgi:hypothetical protein
MVQAIPTCTDCSISTDSNMNAICYDWCRHINWVSSWLQSCVCIATVAILQEGCPVRVLAGEAMSALQSSTSIVFARHAMYDAIYVAGGAI